MMTDRVFKSASLAFMLSLAAVVGVMLGDREVPVERIKGEMVPGKVKPGQVVSIKWTAIKRRRCNGDVHRTITASDGKVHSLENAASSYSTEGNILVRSFQVPFYVSYGPARYHAKVKFYCNPIHAWFPIVVEGPDVAFEVTP